MKLYFALITVCLWLSAGGASAAGYDWMTSVNGSLPLSQLTLPGTHDSGARVEPWGGTARCQELSISEQLNVGVRFLDIRCRHENNSFSIYHGYVSQNLTFESVVSDTYHFLSTNPGETVIMSIKEEHTPENNNRSFEETFAAYVAQNPGKWRLASNIPTLDEARGKIVLFRRFGASNTPKGIDASYFPDNTTFSIGNTMRVQDRYTGNNYETKFAYVLTQLNEARYGGPDMLYVNFCSAYTTGAFGIPNLTGVADYVNPRVETYLTENPSGRFGVILMDFMTADRSAKIYLTCVHSARAVHHPAFFQIVNRNSGKALSIASGNTSEGLPMEQQTLSDTDPHQRWSLAPNESATRFRLSSWSTGKAASIEWGSSSSGAKLQASDYGGNDTHWFDLVDIGGGYFKIRYARSNLVLEIENSGTSNGNRIQQSNDQGTENQQWSLRPWGDYFLRAGTGKYVRTGSTGGTEGDSVVQSTFDTRPWFRWRFPPSTGGGLKAQSVNSPARVVGLNNQDFWGGIPTRLVTYQPNNYGNHKIQLVPKTNGLFEFRFLHTNTNMFLKIAGDSTADGAAVEQAWEGPQFSREFQLERIAQRTPTTQILRPRQDIDPETGTVTLSWPARTGYRYQPQVSTKLGTWQNLGTALIAANNDLMTLSDALGNDRRFYQITESFAD